MRKLIITLTLLLGVMNMNGSIKIDRIEPTDWYVGMQDATLQLMV